MKLSVRDRILLVGMLPPQGDFKTIKLLRVLREDLAFSEEETKDLKLNSAPNGNVSWEPEMAKDKEVEIGEVMTEVIVGLLNDLDAQKKLTVEHLDLYEAFIPAGE